MVRRKKTGTNGSTDGVFPPKAMSLREFGHRLDGMLLDRGWSQADLHRKSGLSKDTISKWVAGRVAPSPYNLSQVAAALNVPLEELYPHYVDSLANDAHRSKAGVEFSSADMRTGLLTVEKRVSVETAQKVMELLKNDAAD